MSNLPWMIMLVGLPGSGKSTFAKTIKCGEHGETPVIHSSDALREEMYGDAAIQGDNNKLFQELHKRIREDLKRGKSVVYDATNVKKKTRIGFLRELKNIDCIPVCIVIATEYALCLKNNERRSRKVPVNVIRNMQNNFEPPHESEGFHDVAYYFTFLDRNGEITEKCPTAKYNLNAFFKIADKFEQDNSHHSLTLGEHCAKAGELLAKKEPENYWLYIATMLHDIGKLYTKSNRNSKGEIDGECHYFNHHTCGAYISMFYAYGIAARKKQSAPLSYVTNLIYYHMHPYLAWKQSEKALKRDREMLGEEMFHDILALHEADVAAH